MRLLFVVQRYGIEVAGGAELLCRNFATRLDAAGHDVEVVTSCALNYTDWANHFPAGADEVDGITVHRLPVAQPRHPELFNALNSRVVWGNPSGSGRSWPAGHLQRAWMRAQGPYLPQLPAWLHERAPGYDAVAFFTYLYYTTWAGLPAAAAVAPTVLHPAVHDEPALAVRLFDTTFRHAGAFAFLTEEEAEITRRRAPSLLTSGQPGEIVGTGVDLAAPLESGSADDAVFRAAYGLGDRPYLLFLGRVEPGKASDELFDFFRVYKQRAAHRAGDDRLALVIVGEVVVELPDHPDVISTGYVTEAQKRSALAGALALVQPSYFESFSMVLTEAWAQHRPALVQGHCAVLEGQARRSGGGIPYRGFAEFEAAVDMLLADPALGDRLGRAGRRYVEARYAWNAVIDRYERLVTQAISGFRGSVRNSIARMG